MIKTSHELPLCLLNKSYDWNDYEFCLPTYWFKSEEYKQHYLNVKKEGRFIIADNGLFEGDSFTQQQLIEFVNELALHNPCIIPLDFIQKIEQNEPEKKIPSTAANATNLSFTASSKIKLGPESGFG